MINKIKRSIPKSILNRVYRIAKPLVKYYYKGDKVVCDICSAKFKAFRSYGYDIRRNAFCEKCGSLERHRLLWKYIHEETGILSKKRRYKILHFAPEKYFYELFDGNANIDYVPCDLEPELFKFKGKSEVQKVDITNIQFDDDTFDFILCNHVLEHIPDDALAMKELFRVLKKGAFGIFMVPLDHERELTYEDISITSPEERTVAFKQYNHVRVYGLDIKKRLEKSGFNVKDDKYVKEFSKRDRFKYGFMENEIIYKCSKN